MHLTLLTLHSFFRWFVLASLVFSVVRAYSGWLLKKEFLAIDNSLRHWTATVVHIQLVFGILLYSVSPIVGYFLHHFREGMQEREVRFFGMEHSSMMLLAVTAITIGSVKAKRKATSREKFMMMALWYSAGLLIILSSIPWPFSPLTSRPYFRPF